MALVVADFRLIAIIPFWPMRGVFRVQVWVRSGLFVRIEALLYEVGIGTVEGVIKLRIHCLHLRKYGIIEAKMRNYHYLINSNQNTTLLTILSKPSFVQLCYIPFLRILHLPPSIIYSQRWMTASQGQEGSGQLEIDLQPYIIRILFRSMRDLMDSDSDLHPPYPTAFLADLSPIRLPLETLPNLSLSQVDRCSMEEGTFQSEKSTRKKMAGVKSREKKKRHLQELQESVRLLTAEVQACENAISRCKDELVEALRTASTASEHSYTFAELERATLSEADLDRVDMLLDLIQNRIGANARERQARLDYNFKQIINSLFPAMHRYLMHAALYRRDVFADDDHHQSNSWTISFYEELQLRPRQRKGFTDRQEAFGGQRRETVGLISKLKSVKEQLKAQEEIFERVMTHIREEMNPLQSARLILFGEKNKLRKQFSLFCDEFAHQQPSKLRKRE